jgi:putative aldouronate transport system permease protein
MIRGIPVRSGIPPLKKEPYRKANNKMAVENGIKMKFIPENRFGKKPLIKSILKTWQLQLIAIPVLAYFIIFCYVPMYGIILAFKDFNTSLGIWGSPWVGFKHFERFFKAYYFWPLIGNTVWLSLYGLIAGFPLPIIFALMLNELRSNKYKRVIQTVSYAPHFISQVVIVGLLMAMLSPNNGIVNMVLKALGFETIYFIGSPKWFSTIYVFSGVWQELGFGSVIYFAALSGVSYELHEAAIIDGATKLQRIWHVNLPAIKPTIIILMIFSIGSIMNVGFEKIYLMQNDMVKDVSEVIATYVYKEGLGKARYDYTTAIGLFNSGINFILLASVNFIAKKVGEISLW